MATITEATNSQNVDNEINNSQTSSATETQSKSVSRRRKLVILGTLLVLAGWLSMMLHPYVSLGCTIAGLIISIIGVRIPPGPRRDIATTSIVAASVLLLVFAIFATALYLI